jgi:geranylgeranyl pyrophosphate synthase
LSKIAFFTPVQDSILEVEQLMRAQADNYHPDLRAVLDHLISSGGKRVRPAVTLLTGLMLGASHRDLVTLAAAIELLHTATLVHDDLIDSSLLRRGIPTLNSRWSPGSTVLTGDFIFARAAQLAADTNSIPVMKLFAKTLTTIVNGEITQQFSARCLVDRKQYYERIYAKTASLFETSAACAALMSPVSASCVEDIRRYGYEIGMAFQIVDDILDFTAELSSLGKPVGSDLRQGLITLPTLIYMENNPQDEDAAMLRDGRFDLGETRLTRLVDQIRQSPAIDSAHTEARAYVERGLSSLRSYPPGQERTCLEELALYIVDRRS